MRTANIFLLTALIIGGAICPGSAQIFSAEAKATNFAAKEAAFTIATITHYDGSVYHFTERSSEKMAHKIAAPAAICQGLWNGATNSIRFRVISQTQIDTFSISFANLGGCSQVTVKTSPVFISGNTFTISYNIPTISSGSLTGTFSSDGNSISGNYTYRNFNCGSTTVSGPWSGTPRQTCTVSVDERDGPEIPQAFALHPNYPNPFNPSTSLRFGLPQEAQVTLKVYNTIGAEVATLVNEKRNAGFHTIVFEAANLPSGVYFSVLSAGETRQVRRMLLIR